MNSFSSSRLVGVLAGLTTVVSSAAFAQVAMQYPTVVERLAELSTSDVVSVGL